MKIISKIMWFLIACLGAASLAVVTKVANPSEKVNAMWLITAAACIFILAYRFYSAFLAAKVLALDPSRQTPAFTMRDGVDYHPTNKWVLFGHHFAAIAGAGPLIGPMLAAQFGYLPGFLWILVGAVFGGAVHDMVVLAASVRRGGRSLAQIAREELGPVSGFVASIAILFIIIITLAGLGLAVVNALAESPWGTFTIAMTIPIALFMGIYLYKIRIGRISEVTVLGVAGLFSAVILGHFVPGSAIEPIFNLPRNAIVLGIAIYGFVASVLPVWLLLCPRDYLSTYMKMGTILILAIGVIFMNPQIEMPMVTQFIHGGGPIIPGTLFPFMFITIACGAISGFHSLISSGTTPKMISSEADIRPIGFGAMLMEAFVSTMAIIAATILIPGDYFAINSKLAFDALASMGFPVDRVTELSRMVGTNVVGRPGGAVSLAVGMASILSNIPGMKGFMPYWYNFALMFEALFILTTVDTGTRVARFILQEFGSYVYKPFNKQGSFSAIVVSSLIVVAAWGYLIYSGNISTIWPMFGVANQLLAATALGVGTTMIIKSGKVRYAWATFIPMTFMFITTLTASWDFVVIFWDKANAATSAAEAFNLRLDSILVMCIATLAVIMLIDMLHKWFRYFANVEQVESTSQVQAS
jgi:carbon starvation protein